MRSVLVCLAAAAIAAGSVHADAAPPRHSVSTFGGYKYPSGFHHFNYVNPDAPKGGAIKVTSVGTFETMNPFYIKGRKEPYAQGLLFDTLMTRSQDEPDTHYSLVAVSAEIPQDGSQVVFNIDSRARFHDGSKVTADDIAFSFNLLRDKGLPIYRVNYAGVARVEVLNRLQVRFVFKPGKHRGLPVRLAGLPVLSKAWYQEHDFSKTTYEAPLSSGPYRVARLEPGRSVTYERVKDYWAKDLPVNLGRFNFDRIGVDYYRDRELQFQAFFSKQYDYREEFTSRQWATQYDKPPVRKGLVVRETIPDETPSGVQMFVLNLRREKLQDIRVRHALDLAFDFEWTNKTLFFSLYERTNSIFENSVMAAYEPPSREELALLRKWQGQVPDEVFTTPFQSPVTDGSGRIRGNLRKAARLLKQAGYRVVDGALVNQRGEPLSIEFLLWENSFSRIINPYIANLKRLGIQGRTRVIDSASFKQRLDSFDFDIIVNRIVQPLTPGSEQHSLFGSRYADLSGAGNYGGIKNPVVDALIDNLAAARSRAQLTIAARALDRVLMWNRYIVTQWYKGSHNIAYWNKFDRPKTKPKYDLGVIDTWWYNPEKARMVEEGRAPAAPPGALPPP